MNSRSLHHMLIALAVLAAQWAGIAHGIEHRHALQGSSKHGHAHAQEFVQAHPDAGSTANDLLHSCLLFDGLTTAQTVVSTPDTSITAPLLAQLGPHSFVINAVHDSLSTQRVRVRDPPVFS